MLVRRRPIAAALSCLLLVACTGDDGGDDPPATPGQTPSTADPSGPLPQLREQPSASDGGTVTLREQSFTVLDERATGPTDVVWAAVLENTSATDLLAYVDVELVWTNAAGDRQVFEWHESPQQRSYDVLPEKATVVGGATTVPFAPDAVEVSVHSDEWYPMQDLDANGVSVGVDVTQASIDVDNAVRVRAGYLSSYDDRYRGGDEDLRLLVVLRDAAGDLLGAVAGTLDFAVPLPGEQEQGGSVRLSQWPAAADENTSELVIVKVCCAWVGVT
jgi:hypothetical protein